MHNPGIDSSRLWSLPRTAAHVTHRAARLSILCLPGSATVVECGYQLTSRCCIRIQQPATNLPERVINVMIDCVPPSGKCDDRR